MRWELAACAIVVGLGCSASHRDGHDTAPSDDAGARNGDAAAGDGDSAVDAGAATVDGTAADCGDPYFGCWGQTWVDASVHGFATADINGDGVVDLVPARGQGGQWVDGASLEPHPFDAWAPDSFVARTQAFVYADLDGDFITGQARITTNGCGDCPDYDTLEVSSGDGEGGFAHDVTLPICGGPYALIAADLYGDGRSELVVHAGCFASGGGRVFVYQAGQLREHTPTSSTNWRHMVAADVDGDGRVDLVGIDVTGTLQDADGRVTPAPVLQVRRGLGGAGFGEPVSVALPPQVPQELIALDADGDAYMDMAVLSLDGDRSTVSVLRGAAMPDAIVVDSTTTVPGLTSRLAVAELDGDCGPELLLLHQAAEGDPGRVWPLDARTLEHEPFAALDLEGSVVDVAVAAPDGGETRLWTATDAHPDDVALLWPSSCGPPLP